MTRLHFYRFTLIACLIHITVALAARRRRADCPPAIPAEDIHPYGINPVPRDNPDYCVGFEITHPVEPDLVYESGSLQKIAWKIDPSMAKQLPTSIYRIRVLDATQHNQLAFGENMTIYSMDKYTGEVIFPLEVYNEEIDCHYRIMVVYGNQSVHCIFESVPFVVKPNVLGRFSVPGLAPPSFAVPQWSA